MLEIVPDIAQSTHGIGNIFADIRNVPTRPHMVLGMFLLAFSVIAGYIHKSYTFQMKWSEYLNLNLKSPQQISRFMLKSTSLKS